MNGIWVDALLSLLVLGAGVLSVEIGISAAIVEMLLGVVAANLLALSAPSWMVFVASLGGVLLTFLAGAEVDPELLRSKLKQSLILGGASFALPYAAILLFTRYVAGWEWNAALVAGCALSTTSLAVVYSVLVETGICDSEIGKVIMAATFVTDMGTALALSLTFADLSLASLGFLLISAVIIVAAPRLLPVVFRRYAPFVVEPEIRLIFFLLLAFVALAQWGKGHAVLPVFVLGLVLSRSLRTSADLVRKLRVAAFAMITPFFFLNGGMYVSVGSLVASLGLFFALFGVKLATKLIAVMPLARRFLRPHETYVGLLMSTGLTFGTISSVFGLQAGYIDQTQFSILVAVVIASAVVPTIIAQRFFSPVLSPETRDEILAHEEEAA